MKYMLIDADTGIDDSLAILHALKTSDVKVVGIVSCFGNNSAIQAADNTLRLLKLANIDYEVPVVVGTNASLDGITSMAPACIHGTNGIGDVCLEESKQKPLDVDPTRFILQMAEEYKHELIYVSLGRLTNLAKACLVSGDLKYKIKKVVTMGGTLYHRGNITPFAEANIYGDPLAADIVFGYGFHLDLVGLDVTTKTFIHKEDLDFLWKHCRKDCKGIVDYLKEAMNVYFEFHRTSEGFQDMCYVHDPLAMVLAIDPSLGTYQKQRVSVEFESEPYKGKLLVDDGFDGNYDRDEISICVDVDSSKAIRKLFSVFQDR